jgi:hypothetical protein
MKRSPNIKKLANIVEMEGTCYIQSSALKGEFGISLNDNGVLQQPDQKLQNMYLVASSLCK